MSQRINKSGSYKPAGNDTSAPQTTDYTSTYKPPNKSINIAGPSKWIPKTPAYNLDEPDTNNDYYVAKKF